MDKRNSEIVVKPATQVCGKHKLENLVAKMSAKYSPIEEDWGKSVGKEV